MLPPFTTLFRFRVRACDEKPPNRKSASPFLPGFALTRHLSITSNSGDVGRHVAYNRRTVVVHSPRQQTTLRNAYTMSGFEGFSYERVKVHSEVLRREIEISAYKAGSGPGLLLLHGFPQTH
jgi:hypothetical protein